MKALTVRKGFFFALVAFGMVHFCSARGQGLILFFNNNLTGPNGLYRAGVYQDNYPLGAGELDPKGDSTIGAGPGFTAGLFLASNLKTPLATTTFRTNTAVEVFAEAKVVAVPGVAAGQTANLVVRVWRTSEGIYELSSHRGERSFTSRALGETVPVDMGPGFTGFEMDVEFPIWAPPYAPLSTFETPSIADGHVQFGTPPSWTIYNEQNINGTTDAVGVMNATGSQQYLNGVPDGRNAGLVHLAGEQTGEAGLQQRVAFSIAAHANYILRVRVGNPAAGLSGIGYRNLEGFPGYRIDLVSSDGTVLASDNNTLAIAEGEFKTSTIEFAVGESHAKIGQELHARLVNLNQRRAGEPRGFEVNFDAVSFATERLNERVQLGIWLGENDYSVLYWSDLEGDVALQQTTDIMSTEWQTVTNRQTAYGERRIVGLPRTATATYYRVTPAP